MSYAIYQMGHAVFGVGATVEAAIAEANEWLYTPITAADLARHSERVCGSLVVIAVTDRLAAAVAKHGGDLAIQEVEGLLGYYDLSSPE